MLVIARILPTALAAAGRGYPVIPVRITAKGKFPAIRTAHPEGDPRRGKCRGECGASGHGIWDASCDEARVLDLFAAAPGATGYAVGCGMEPHNILGLDLDRKNGADGVARLLEIAETCGFAIPDTIEVVTPNGGLHKWLTLPRGTHVPNYVGRVGLIAAPGIDIRSRGGQLVGPGSRGPAGTYRLASAPDAAIATAPDGLVKLLMTARAPGARDERRPMSHGRRIHGLVATLLEAQPGQRNSMLFWTACRMAETVNEGGIGDRDARELLLSAAERIGLDHSEAAQSISSAFARIGATR